MNTLRKGFTGVLFLVIVAVLLICVGAFLYIQQTQLNQPAVANPVITNQVAKIVSTTQSPFTITSPKNGDVFTGGQTYTITWTSASTTTNHPVDIFLHVPDYPSSTDLTMIGNLAAGIPNTGSYSWAIDPKIPTGNYSVVIIDDDTISDGPGYSGPPAMLFGHSATFSIHSAVPTSSSTSK